MNTVIFKTEDTLIQTLFDTAEERLKGNLRNFGGRIVLVEGAGYEKIWLETQPMGGEMYAKRNLRVGINNQLLFMEHIRKDGRLPGSIALIGKKPEPQYDKLQGFCFPSHALNVYYLMGEENDYLMHLAETLERFDSWLWHNRDTDGDGCLESFCRYDTGEDGALRYGDAPNAWEDNEPPFGLMSVPMASLDIMSWSYAARTTMAEIAHIIKRNDLEKRWLLAADNVRDTIEKYLWDDRRLCFFDRNRNHEMQDVVTHNTLKAMYWGSISKRKASLFVGNHLLNASEFWTGMPLPSVAANDPMFRNIPENNWNGQVEALTYQRAIRALENYGYDSLIPVLGRKLFNAVGKDCMFVQQFDPFTGAPSITDTTGGKPTYGPALLSVLEYIARLYGIHREKNEIFWGCSKDLNGEYVQVYNDNEYRIVHSEGTSECFINGKWIFRTDDSLKLVTDVSGATLRIVRW